MCYFLASLPLSELHESCRERRLVLFLEESIGSFLGALNSPTWIWSCFCFALLINSWRRTTSGYLFWQKNNFAILKSHLQLKMNNDKTHLSTKDWSKGNRNSQPSLVLKAICSRIALISSVGILVATVTALRLTKRSRVYICNYF